MHNSPIRNKDGTTTTSLSAFSSADTKITEFDDTATAASGVLPEGWKEHFDPNTKRPFYVHK